jgi:hypothetical protein
VRFELRPLTRDDANAFVEQLHRHRPRRLPGHLFAIGVTQDGTLRGVAMVCRPVARGFEGRLVADLRRLCTDGTPNACSFLLAASWRAARALGYRKLVTYTLASESGVSLRAAGWIPEASVRGRSWSCESRPRQDVEPIEDKVRWRAA